MGACQKSGAAMMTASIWIADGFLPFEDEAYFRVGAQRLGSLPVALIQVADNADLGVRLRLCFTQQAVTLSADSDGGDAHHRVGAPL